MEPGRNLVPAFVLTS